MSRIKNYITIPAILVAFLIPAVAFAAGNDYIINQGTGMGTLFDTKLIEISKGILEACQKILLIMTAVAGMMIAWGIEDGKKLIWQLIFGFGLAVNFGSLLMDVGIWDFVTEAELAKQNFVPFQFEYKNTAKDFDFLGKFMTNYQNNIIIPGSIAILPYCLKLLIIICIIDATYEYASKSLSGDKVQYTISVLFKLGIYIYFMSNWIELMNALETGFEFIGFKAGGADTVNLNNQPNEIINNAIKIFSKQLEFISDFSWTQWGLILINIVGLIVIFFLLVITACQLFMAKIEFLTMALLTLPLLAFGTSERFNFLCNKAIGAMFNLAIKVCCICFITTISLPFIQSFTKQIEQGGLTIGIILQTVLGCIILFLMTTKIPELVQGLLSGTPSLSGGGMMAMTARGAHIMYTSGKGALIGGRNGYSAIGGNRDSLGGIAKGVAGGAIGGFYGGVKGSLMDLSKQAYGSSAFGTTMRALQRENISADNDIINSSRDAYKTTKAATSQAVKNAAEYGDIGMQMGAKLGSPIGPVGTVVGGTVGALAGTVGGAVGGVVKGAADQMKKNAAEKTASNNSNDTGGTRTGKGYKT